MLKIEDGQHKHKEGESARLAYLGQKIEGLVANFENIFSIESPFVRAGFVLKLKDSVNLLEINRFPVYNFSLIQKLY